MNLRQIACSILLFGSTALGIAQAPVAKPLGSSTQMIVVTTADWSAVQGRLQRFERAHLSDPWTPIGNPIAIVVGKNGTGWGAGIIATDDPVVRSPQDPVKKEGDGKSPAGIFAIGTAFGYASQPPSGWKIPYISLTPSVECVDDAASHFYNRILDRASVSPDWHSSELMSQAGDAYRWGAVIEHNPSATPYAGSCVFLHIWAGPTSGTAGCTAMPQQQLEPILAWLDPSKNPLLVQLPVAQYEKLKARWNLPTLPNP
jgi:L,D-peptidoglycan transpeptidase YkuD (ErfK/YbiS/YcfS/YnhG family)